MIKIKLTAYNMGQGSTEGDFGEWVSYVREHVSAFLGLPQGSVAVDQYPFQGGPDRNAVSGAGEMVRESVCRWLGCEGWEAFCAARDAEPTATASAP